MHKHLFVWEGDGKVKILVVDDDKLNLKVAEGYIKTFFPKYNIILCQQSKLVLDLLKSESIDIILLDIMMPEISGIELIREIRLCHEFKDIQILMLTSLTDTESFAECFELGANDYLRKPINVSEFKARIKASVNTSENMLMLRELYERMKTQNIEIKNINAQLKDTQFHLIQSEKLAAIGELAAGVAHEINNPFGYVGSNLETMSNYLFKMRSFIENLLEKLESVKGRIDESSNEELINFVKELYRKNKIAFIIEDIGGIIQDSKDGIQKVAEIVKSLRNFARTGMEIEKKYCCVRYIIDEVLLILRNEVKYIAEIKIECPDEIEVYCNKGQLSQVLLNIIINAMQSIKAQKKSILGNLLIDVSKGNKYILISIKDDGPGISQENLSKIFNPFFTTKEVGQGTGLGLSISHDIIVNKHHGMIDVNSTLGVGTQFIIRLPINIAGKEFEQR